MKLNRLLIRLIEKEDLSLTEAPSIENWKKALALLSSLLDESDRHQQYHENISLVATQEMETLYKALETQSAENMQIEKSKLQSVIESVPCMVFWINNDGEVDGANPLFISYFSRNENPVIGKKLSEIKELSHLEVYLNLAIYGINEQFNLKMEINTPKFSNPRIINFIGQKRTNLKSMVVIGLDITEQIEKELELMKIRETAEESAKLASLGEMAAGIAHEINNPLSVITMNLDLIKESLKSNPDNQSEILKKIDKLTAMSERIRKIIQGLRTYSRNSENDPFVATSINQVIDETIDLFKSQISKDGIELIRKNEKNNCAVNIRSSQISQVLLNLLINARDAIAKLETKVIEIAVTETPEFININIYDSGPGISIELEKKIFEPFFTTKPVGVGTGLGLSICQGIMQEHKGSIQLDRSTSRTCFVLSFPKVNPDS